jgi:hypothetical protein
MAGPAYPTMFIVKAKPKKATTAICPMTKVNKGLVFTGSPRPNTGTVKVSSVCKKGTCG